MLLNVLLLVLPYVLCSSLTLVKFPGFWTIDSEHNVLYANSLEKILLNIFGYPRLVPSPIYTVPLPSPIRSGFFFVIADWEDKGNNSVQFTLNNNLHSLENFLSKAIDDYDVKFERLENMETVVLQIKNNWLGISQFDEGRTQIDNSIVIFSSERSAHEIDKRKIYRNIEETCNEFGEELACFILDGPVPVNDISESLHKRFQDVPSQIDDSDFVDMSYPIAFHLIFWTSFLFIVLVCLAWYKLITMDPGKESILYHSFGSFKPKQD